MTSDDKEQKQQQAVVFHQVLHRFEFIAHSTTGGEGLFRPMAYLFGAKGKLLCLQYNDSGYRQAKISFETA